MKRLPYLVVAALLCVPGLFAQEITDHVNVGVFGNYVRLNDGDLNLAGVGARLSFNIVPVVQFELSLPISSIRRSRRDLRVPPQGRRRSDGLTFGCWTGYSARN